MYARCAGEGLFINILNHILVSIPSSLSLYQTFRDPYYFSEDNVNVTCNGSTSCSLGDVATVNGALEVYSDFDAYSVVTMQLCFVMGTVCPGSASRSGDTICEWLTATDGQTCGEAGNYTVYHLEDIPSAEDIPYTWQQWLVQNTATVKVSVDSEEECVVEVETVSPTSTPSTVSPTSTPSVAADAYEMSYSMAGMAMVALVGAAAYAKKRSGSKNGREDDKGTHFLEMGDVTTVV